MTMTNITASSRIALVGEEGVHSLEDLTLAYGTFGYPGVGDGKAYWTGSSLFINDDLLVAHVDDDGGGNRAGTRPYGGILALGSGIVNAYAHLSPGSVVGGPCSSTIYLTEDGVVIASATFTDAPATGLRGFFMDLLIDLPGPQPGDLFVWPPPPPGTGLLVKEGSVYRTEFHQTAFPLIWAYSSGTGAGPLHMHGNLLVGGAIMPMRGSMTVDRSL